MRLPPDSLAFQMLAAAAAVRAVNEGSALPQAIDAAAAQYRLDRLDRLDRLERAQSAAARGALQDLAYRTMRHFGTTRALVTQMVSRPPGALVDAVLAIALTLLIEAEEGEAPDTGRQGGYTAFTVVDQAVSAVASDPKTAHARGMVNAVLRRFLRERAALLQAVRSDEEARWNLPAWWLRQLRAAYPDVWQQIAEQANSRPPMTLRVNPARVSVPEYLRRLADAGIAAEQVGAQAVRLARPMPVGQIPGFEAGDVSVQDAGAQLAGPLLELAEGQRVLDACAAPGGKTGHLLELAPVELVSLESDPTRARRIDENLTRLGQRAAVVVGDASRPSEWWDGQPFDRILADVPCSASGIVRRHPDIRWLRRESDVGRLINEQRRIVSQLWPLLKPGGMLVYVTCSIFPTEGEEQAQWFGEQLPDAIRLQAPGQLLPRSKPGPALAAERAGVPDNGSSTGIALPTDHDGFFYARFQKRP